MTWTIDDVELTSRLVMGTGGASSLSILEDAWSLRDRADHGGDAYFDAEDRDSVFTMLQRLGIRVLPSPLAVTQRGMPCSLLDWRGKRWRRTG